MSARTWVIRPLVLPVGETQYTVDPVDYPTGLEIQDIMAGTHKKIKTGTPDSEFFKLALGPAWDSMAEDGQSFPVVFRAGIAAIQFQVALVSGLDCDAAVAIGEQAWDAAIDPEALAAALTAAMQKKNATNGTGSTPSTSSGSGRKTRSPASTSGTKSRQGTRPTKPKQASKAPASRSRGTRSGATSGPGGSS